MQIFIYKNVIDSMGPSNMRLATRFVAILVALIIIAAWISTPIGSYGENPARTKVIWLSVDSASYYRLYNLSVAGKLPAFKTLFEGGAHGPLIVVYPSATAVNHASLSSGAPPGVTGIVGNSIVLPGSRVTSSVSGFNGKYMLAEPIWVPADRSGLRSYVVSFPQSTPLAWNVSVERTKLFNIYDAFVSPITFSTLYTNNRSIARATYIEVREASSWDGVQAFTSTYRISNIYRAWESSFSIGDSTWYLYLADTTGSGKPDLLAIVPEAKDLSRALEVLKEGSWSRPLNTTINYRGHVYVVAPMFKLIKLDLNDLRLYRGITRPLNTQWFNDEKLARDVWNNVVTRVGAFTDGDHFALSNGWIDVDTYMETVALTNRFFMEFTLYVMRNRDWDFIMTYTPVVDNVYGQFLGTIYRDMPYYDPAKEEYYMDLILRTYMFVDDFIASILRNIDTRKTVLIVTSDHGQCPVKYIVNINAVLYNAGLLSIRGGSVVLNETKAWYAAHGHIFVNIEGRDQGSVKMADYSSVVKSIVDALQSVRDPDTGEPVFDLVVTKQQAQILGLWGDRVGDVVIATRCGYTAAGGVPSVRDGRAVVFTPAVPLRTITGDHGTNLPWYRDLHATFIAYGGDVRPGYLGTISALNIAPTVAKLLGIERPREASAPPLPIVAEVVTSTVTKAMPTTITTTIVEVSTIPQTITQAVTQAVTQTITQTVTGPPSDALSYIAIAIVFGLIGFTLGMLFIRGRASR